MEEGASTLSLKKEYYREVGLMLKGLEVTHNNSGEKELCCSFIDAKRLFAPIQPSNSMKLRARTFSLSALEQPHGQNSNINDYSRL